MYIFNQFPVETVERQGEIVMIVPEDTRILCEDHFPKRGYKQRVTSSTEIASTTDEEVCACVCVSGLM